MRSREMHDGIEELHATRVYDGVNFRQSGVRKGGRLFRGPPPRGRVGLGAPSMPSKTMASRQTVAAPPEGFASRAPRFRRPPSGDDDAPGPGAYAPSPAPASSARFNRKGFGPMASQARRFGSLFAARREPGPGEYAAPPPRAAALASCGTRGSAAFCRPYKEEGAVGSGVQPASAHPSPGPGAYDEGARVRRRRRAKQPFLSSERRFFRGLGETQGACGDGPGSYDPVLPGEAAAGGAGTSSFASTSKRRSFGAAGGPSAPGPGAYDAAQGTTIAAMASRAAAARGGGRLFQVQHCQRAAGAPRSELVAVTAPPEAASPAALDAQASLSTPRPSAVFRSSTGRAEPAGKNAASRPGPGHYDTAGTRAARFHLNAKHLWV